MRAKLKLFGWCFCCVNLYLNSLSTTRTLQKLKAAAWIEILLFGGIEAVTAVRRWLLGPDRPAPKEYFSRVFDAAFARYFSHFLSFSTNRATETEDWALHITGIFSFALWLMQCYLAEMYQVQQLQSTSTSTQASSTGRPI